MERPDVVLDRLILLQDPGVNAWIANKKKVLQAILAFGAKNKKLDPTSAQRALEILDRFNISVDNKMLDDALAADFEDFIFLAAKKNLIKPREASVKTSVRPSARPSASPAREETVFPVLPIEKDTNVYKYLPKSLGYTTAKDTSVNTETIRWAYHPILTPLPTKETGLEQKLGGRVPFFKKGDTWPRMESGPALAFIGQFVDPRYPGTLTQIWVDDLESAADYPEFVVKKIKEASTVDQIRLPMPADVVNAGIEAEEGLIVGWRLVNEVDTYDEIGEDDKLVEALRADELYYPKFKIGGFGNSMQNLTYGEFDYQNIYANQWGDSGSFHISRNGDVQGDMG